MAGNVDKLRRHPEICRPCRAMDGIQRDRAFKGKGFLAAQACKANGFPMTDGQDRPRVYRLRQIGLRQYVENAVNARCGGIGG